MLSKHRPTEVPLFVYHCHRTDTGAHCQVTARNSYYAKQNALRKFELPKDTKHIGITIKCAGRIK